MLEIRVLADIAEQFAQQVGKQLRLLMLDIVERTLVNEHGAFGSGVFESSFLFGDDFTDRAHWRCA